MISQDYTRMMARYNRWQNESLVNAAEALDATERQRNRGAFFGSIMGTFSHLLWGDTIWMSRFDGGAPPAIGIPDSPVFCTDWAAFRANRIAMDARIIDWSDVGSDLGADLTWYSGALGHEVSRPLALCVVHFFNHQTHHRGQIHAMLTAVGARPDDTDLFVMPELG